MEGKVQFRGLRKKIIARFTGVNKQLFFKRNDENGLFGQTLGKPFKLPDGETETVKAVVAWDEGNDNWQPHICFYNWSEENTDGKIAHLNVSEFIENYHPGEIK